MIVSGSDFHCVTDLLELLCDGSDLLHSVLMGRQVALKRLVLLQQSFDVRQGCCLKVFLLQHLLLTYRGQQR